MPTQVTTSFVPKNGGSFYILEDLYLKGGFRVVANATERDAIPASSRKAAMLVALSTDGSFWKLGSDLVTWSEFTGGGGAGANGQDGADGADGKSAYQLAVDGGFVGTVEEWLSSLSAVGIPLALVATSGSYNDLFDKPDLSLPIATATEVGVVQAGSGLSVDASGVLSVTAVGGVSTVNGQQGAVVIDAAAIGAATPAEVSAAIAAVVGAAPEALDTLQELATQMAADEAGIAALTTVISTKADATALTALTTVVSGKANAASLAPVATSGAYADLTGKPFIPVVPTAVSAFTNDSGYQTAAQVATAITTGVAGKADTASLAAVATSGSYNDLTDTPAPLTPATTIDLGGVKIGSGLNVSDEGVISVPAQPSASDTVKGLVQIGEGLSVTNGVVSVAAGAGVTVDGNGNIMLDGAVGGQGVALLDSVIFNFDGLIENATSAGRWYPFAATQLHEVYFSLDVPPVSPVTVTVLVNGVAVGTSAVCSAGEYKSTVSTVGVDITTTDYVTVQIAGSSGEGAYVVVVCKFDSISQQIQTATNTNLGVMKVGTGLLVNNGVVSVDPAYATAGGGSGGVADVLKTYTFNYPLAENGDKETQVVVDLPETTYGKVVKIWLDADTVGTEPLTLALQLTAGSNRGVDASDGNFIIPLSSDQIPSEGWVLVGTNYVYQGLTINPGLLEGLVNGTPENTATNVFNGDAYILMITAGASGYSNVNVHMVVSSSGEFVESVYQMPQATSLALGGVKIGSGLTIDAEGVVSVTSAEITSNYVGKDTIAFSVEGAISPVVGIARWYPPYNVTLKTAYFSIGEASVGTVTAQVKVNGVAVGGVVECNPSEYKSSVVSFGGGIVVTSDDYVTLDVVSGSSGKDLYANVSYETTMVLPRAAYDLPSFTAGQFSSNALVTMLVIPRAITVNSTTPFVAASVVAATADSVFTVKVNGVDVGSFKIAAAATQASDVSWVSTYELAAGDTVTVHSQAAMDATLSGLAFTLKGSAAV